MKYNKFIAVVVSLMLCLSFAGCNNNDKAEQTTTQVQEDYSTKAGISGLYFAEKSAVGGFEVVESLTSDDKDLNGYYTIYFGGVDYGEFLDAKERKTVEEYFDYMKNTLTTVTEGFTADNIVEVDEGNYKKYSRTVTNDKDKSASYQFVILVDNTAFFGTTPIGEMARYNNLIKAINY